MTTKKEKKYELGLYFFLPTCIQQHCYWCWSSGSTQTVWKDQQVKGEKRGKCLGKCRDARRAPVSELPSLKLIALGLKSLLLHKSKCSFLFFFWRFQQLRKLEMSREKCEMRPCLQPVVWTFSLFVHKSETLIFQRASGDKKKKKWNCLHAQNIITASFHYTTQWYWWLLDFSEDVQSRD